MKKIINMLAGGEGATPLKKGVVYAALGTLAALILAIAILVVSSIALTLTDNTGNEPDRGGDGDGDGGIASVKPVELVTLESISALAEKSETDLVKVGDKRTPFGAKQNFYYAKNDNDGVDKLTSSAMTAVDNMLVDFYDANKDKLVTDVGPDSKSKDCNIPLIKNTSASGTEFTIVTFNDESMSGNTLYSWIFANAYKYGFIYKGDEFQYVGVALAAYLRTGNDLTPIKSKTADKAQMLSGGYYAYYVASDATEIKVPKSLAYDVIADGADGYIVVYKK